MKKNIIIIVCVLILISGCSKSYNPKKEICDMTCGERKDLGMSPIVKTPLYDKLCFNQNIFCENCCLYWHNWREIDDTTFKLYSARLFVENGGYYLKDLDCKITWREDLGIIYHYMECDVKSVSQGDVISKYGKIEGEIQIEGVNQTE